MSLEIQTGAFITLVTTFGVVGPSTCQAVGRLSSVLERELAKPSAKPTPRKPSRPRVIKTPRPNPPAPVKVAPFEALALTLHEYTTTQVALTKFDLSGPTGDAVFPVSNRIRHVARTKNQIVAITRHEFGYVGSDGSFEHAEDAAGEDFAWPSGLAVNSEGVPIVMTSHVYNRFFRYDRALDKLVLFAEERDRKLEGLVFDDKGFMLSLEREPLIRQDILHLNRYSPNGRRVDSIPLLPAIRSPYFKGSLQLRFRDGYVVVINHAFPMPKHPILLIDPKTGFVSRPSQ